MENNKLGAGHRLPYKFVILANSIWNSSGGGNSSQQYARVLSKKGYNYTFIGPTETSKTQELMSGQGIDFEKTIVLCSLPSRVFFDFCKALKDKGGNIIYRIVDNWSDMPKNDWYDREVEYAMIRIADLCYASSPALVRQFEKLRNDVRLLPNAADKEEFSRVPGDKPADLKKGTITIGFWGSFWCGWFDWTLIKTVASEKKDWVFNLVGGDVSKIRKEAGDMPANINLVGLKDWNDLYQYLYYFDVCVIPYVPISGAAEANPIKALEYLAGYKPVVSYYNASLEGVPYIYFYHNKSDFIKNIEMAKSTTIDKAMVDDFLQKNTWAYRLQTILEDTENCNSTARTVHRNNCL